MRTGGSKRKMEVVEYEDKLTPADITSAHRSRRRCTDPLKSEGGTRADIPSDHRSNRRYTDPLQSAGNDEDDIVEARIDDIVEARIQRLLQQRQQNLLSADLSRQVLDGTFYPPPQYSSSYPSYWNTTNEDSTMTTPRMRRATFNTSEIPRHSPLQVSSTPTTAADAAGQAEFDRIDLLLAAAMMPKSTRRQRGPVQFSKLSVVHVVEPSYTKSSWYTADDYERFKKERTSDVVAIRLDHSRKKGPPKKRITPTFEESICPIGIEQALSDRGILETLSSKKSVVKCVLLEQARQRTSGIQDPHQIASVSERLSEKVYERAQKRGKFQQMARHVPHADTAGPTPSLHKSSAAGQAVFDRTYIVAAAAAGQASFDHIPIQRRHMRYGPPAA